MDLRISTLPTMFGESCVMRVLDRSVVSLSLDELGMRGSGLAELVLDDVTVPAENMLGPEGKGFTVAMNTLDGGRASISGQANGSLEYYPELKR